MLHLHQQFTLMVLDRMHTRTKIFIITYNNPTLLKENLDSLFSSNANPDSFSVEIINNFSLIFEVPAEYRDRVKVHHQTLRPDWSCGNLSRDWNSAIINGIVDLNNPWCDQLIMAQDDMVWEPDWYSMLQTVHETYTFYSANEGDCLVSVLPEAIKKIGLYDERFSVIGHHEGDWFLRAWLYNGDKSSINDYRHRRVHNPTVEVGRRSRSTGDSRSRVVSYNQTIALNLFKEKWGEDVMVTSWGKGERDRSKIKPLIPSYIMYPYFEKDIEDLKGKNFLFQGEEIS